MLEGSLQPCPKRRELVADYMEFDLGLHTQCENLR